MKVYSNLKNLYLSKPNTNYFRLLLAKDSQDLNIIWMPSLALIFNSIIKYY